MFSDIICSSMELLGKVQYQDCRYKTARLAVSKEQHTSCPRGFMLSGRFFFMKGEQNHD